MKDFFYAIESLFDALLSPFAALANLELDSWFGANIFSWIFILIGFVAMVYWMIQIRRFDKNNEEDKSITSHSYL